MLAAATVRRSASLAVCCAFLAVVAAACAKTPGAPVVGPLRVRDDLGREVALAAPARRVVSLAPSLTEMLCAIGGDSSLVGVTSYCDFPPSVRNKPRVGDLVHPSLETIASLRPDLVVLSMEGNSRSTFDRLGDLRIPLMVSNPTSLEGMFRTLRALGLLLGDSLRAVRVADSLRDMALRAVAPADAAPVSVLFLVSSEPLMAAGEHTVLDELIRIAGARNAAAGGASRYPVLTREEIYRRNPDVLLWPSDLHLAYAALLKRFPEWKRLRPFGSGIAAEVDANLFLRPGPRLLQGLTMLRTLADSARDRLNTR